MVAGKRVSYRLRRIDSSVTTINEAAMDIDPMAAIEPNEERSERAEEIDVTRARAALKRAEKRLIPAADSDVDFARAQDALRRALLRVQVGETRGMLAGATVKHG